MFSKKWILVVMASICAGSALADKKKFGSEIVQKSAVPLSTAIKNFKSGKPTQLTVSGKVQKVCVKKGCWMVIEEGGQKVRVTFKDYGFFVPQKLLGNSILAEGELVEKTISKEEAAHYLEDEGASPEKIAKAKAKKTYRFVATGVEVKS